MKLKNHTLNVGYPVYGASFANDHTVIVAGGGGDGNNGIPNKMTAILVQFENTKKPLKRYRELTLNENEDSVMSMDYGNGTILAGINENLLMMAKGVNKHLRKFKFENEHLKFVESVQIHPNASSNIYQKLTIVSLDGSVGVIVMSDSPSSVYIIDCSGDLEEKFKVVADGDVKDIAISQDGKLMCYITSSDFEVISLITGRSVFKTKLGFIMSKVRFLDNNDVIIAGCKDNGVYMAKFSIVKSKVVQEKTVFKNVKGVTSIDVNINNDLTAIATSSYSLLLIRTSDFKVIKVLNKVHEFAITKVVFSGNGKYLASCSAANTVNVIEIPSKFAASKSLIATAFQYIVSILLVAILSISFQYLYENGYVGVAIEKVQEIYEAYKPQDSSSYFTIESIPSFESETVTPNDAESTTTATKEYISSSELDTSLQSFTSWLPPIDVRNDNEERLDYSGFTESSMLTEELENFTPTISDLSSATTTLYDDYDKKTREDVNATENEDSISQKDTINLQDYTLKGDEIYKSGDGYVTNSFKREEVMDIEKELTEKSLNETTLTEILASEVLLKRPSFTEALTKGASEENDYGVTIASSISQYTKEVVKEVTSIVVSTSVAVSTSVETSTTVKVLTEIETSTSVDFTTSLDISTAIETSIILSTQVVVQTVTTEVIIGVTSTAEPENSSHIRPISNSKLAAIELDSSIYDTFSSKIDIADDFGIESSEPEAVNQTEILTSELITVKDQSDKDFVKEKLLEDYVDSDNLTIQILPDFEVFTDPEEAIKEEERIIMEELKNQGEEVNIQIEPERIVFEDEESANKEQERLVAEELIGSESESKSTVLDESDLTEDSISATNLISHRDKHEKKHRKLDITPITPIVRLQQETPDVPISEKDEL
ncbi:hypothetical protein CANINC_004678 [Pichia inconspicua]|uniref:Guanine nucleotide-exchange factor SEC12 n=1 Tax=Pichia inconspicua TaxID=52247 RepID=A0A4T0WVY1_9ASCO|nr:hypothetical protein CANINC_004678 [[Candida] inconspicua]